jgi:hypothetical protein
MCSLIAKGFGSLYVLALIIWLIGTFGWSGNEPDPLSGVFLVILGQPWVRWTDMLPEAWWPFAAALTPALNVSILLVLCRLFTLGHKGET